MLFDLEILLFLCLVGLGTLVQTITGFAMGLIIIGGVAALGPSNIATTAAVISLVSFTNTVVALRNSYQHINLKYLVSICIGLIPMIWVGVHLLDYLSDHAYHILKIILGLVIITAGMLQMLKPTPYANPSSRVAACLVGALGGMLVGLYAAGGAPLAYFMYRQPIAIRVIRATLLASFAVSTTFRIGAIVLEGHIDQQVLSLTGLSIPLVIAITLISNHWAMKLPDQVVKKVVSVIMILLGGFLIAG